MFEALSSFLPWKKPTAPGVECRVIEGKAKVFVNGADRTADLLMSYVGKAAQDDPRTSGGWDILSGIPSWTGANEIWRKVFAHDLEMIYETAVVVYACTRKICLTAQEAPLKIGLKTKKGWKDQETHPMQILMRNPNEEMSYSEFLWHYVAHLELTGRTYALKWRNKAKYVTEVWPVPSSMIKEVRYPSTGKLAGYLMFQGANKDWKPIAKGDIVRQIYPDPKNISAALGPLQASLREVQTDSERQDYIVEMLCNARTPGMIFTQPEGWTPEQKDEVRAVILDGLGKGRRGRPLFMDGDKARIDQMAPLKDLDWPGLTTLSECRICSAFDVPPIVIGLRSGLENGTYSNYEQAIKAFYQGKMVPTWALLDGGFTRGLLRDEFETQLEAYHDTSDVRGLRDDQDKAADRAVKLFTGGLVTRNEGRQMCGLDTIPGDEGGDLMVLPINLVPSGEEEEDPLLDNGQPTQAGDDSIGEPNQPAPKDGGAEPTAPGASGAQSIA